MAAVAVLEDLQEVVASRGVERFEAPVVEDEQIDAAERAQQTRVAAVAARQCEIAEQSRVQGLLGSEGLSVQAKPSGRATDDEDFGERPAVALVAEAGLASVKRCGRRGAHPRSNSLASCAADSSSCNR